MRLVLLLAWLTLFPERCRLPQMSHEKATAQYSLLMAPFRGVMIVQKIDVCYHTLSCTDKLPSPSVVSSMIGSSVSVS
jgi:hypothetical protein